MSSADLIRRELSFGDQDPITGWLRQVYIESTIKGSIQPKGSGAMRMLPVGSYSQYDHTLFTEYVVKEGDQIVDQNLEVYELNTVTKVPLLNKFSHRICEAIKKDLDATNRPATSGTWNTDSESLTTDPRSRNKIYLDIYLSLPDTNYITCFEGANYPVKYLFNDDYELNLDLAIVVGKEPASSLIDYFNGTYAFIESIPFKLYAVDKAGLTATNLVETAEMAIRKVVTNHPLGSIRSIQAIKHTPVDLGGRNYLWNTDLTLRYKRANTDYTPTVPTVSWGDIWIYDGDHISGGAEGTWTETEMGSVGTFEPLIGNEDWLDINISSAGGSEFYYVENGTNLGLNSSLYPYVRTRFVTSNSTIKACVQAVFSDASVQNLVPDTSSALGATVATATLQSGKTLDHILLYANGGVGHVYYDFVEVFAGTYTMPNCIHLKKPKLLLRDAVTPMPWRVGSNTQGLGAENSECITVHDLDMEPSNLTWLRPQATAIKTDVTKTDIFTELHQTNANDTQPWHWFNFGEGQMKARLFSVEPDYQDKTHIVTCGWRESPNGNLSSELFTSRFNT